MAYALLKTSIECLSNAALARDTLQGVKLVSNAVADSYETMTAHRAVIRRFEGCRNQLDGITPLSKAGSTALMGMRLAFDALKEGFQRSLRMDEKILKMTTEQELRGLVSESSEISDSIDAAWRVLPTAINAVSAAMVDETRPSAAKTMNRLRLTRSEMSEGKDYLLKLFPASVSPDYSRAGVIPHK